MDARSQTSSSDEQTPEKESLAKKLVDLVSRDAELFHSETKLAYARVRIGGHLQILRCRGQACRRYMAKKLYDAEGKAPSSEALSSALNVIEAMAQFDGNCYELHNRVAYHDGAIWYDLSDPEWRAVKITPRGWEIVEEPPILFIRHEHQSAQVQPIRGGAVDRIFDFIPVGDDDTRILLLVILVALLIPDIPHPVPVLHGPQGAGKSSTFRLLRRITDPSIVEILSLSADGKELLQVLSHHWVALFDNVTRLQDWQSDALCRAITGESQSKRVLYTDDDDFIYRYRRCVGLNGINIAATRADLLDRSILVALERIPVDERRSEEELEAAFADARPYIVGGILDALSRALRLHAGIQLGHLPRMADFARWGCAIAVGLGHSPKDFLAAYEGNIRKQNEEVVEGNPVAAATVAFMADKEEWQGRASELLAELNPVAEREKIDIKSKSWPKAANTLSRRLNEVKPNLQDAGIAVSRAKSGQRFLTIEKIAESIVPIVQTVHDQEKQDVSGTQCVGDADDMDDTTEEIVQTHRPLEQAVTASSEDVDDMDDTDGTGGSGLRRLVI